MASNQVLIELIQTTLKKGADFRFPVKGFSMFPLIRDSDRVTITPLKTDSINFGQVVAFVLSPTGRLAIHRIVGKKNKSYFVKGDNTSRCDGLIPRENILGCVTKIERRNKSVYLGLGLARIPAALLSRMKIFWLCSYIGMRLPCSFKHAIRGILNL